MKFHCIYCHHPTKNSGNFIKMCCICDDDTRLIQIDEILMGFHNDKVYLLSGNINNVYGENKNLLTGLYNGR